MSHIKFTDGEPVEVEASLYLATEDGTVVNVVLADEEVAGERGWVLAPTDPPVGIGWATADGGKTWQPPPEPDAA